MAKNKLITDHRGKDNLNYVNNHLVSPNLMTQNPKKPKINWFLILTLIGILLAAGSVVSIVAPLLLHRYRLLSAQRTITLPSEAPSPPPSTVRPFTPQPQTITAVENDFMSMQLKGVSKDQSGNVRLAFVITNKTSDNLYLGLYKRGNITDNFGQVCDGQILQGLANVGSSANTPDNFTLISPNSTLTVGSSGCRFPTSTEFNASFPLVRYQLSTTNPAGEQTKFSVGFTGLTLP